MRSSQTGDATAYRRLLIEVEPWLRRFFARRLPPGMIEDAVQDTLIAVHEKRHAFDPTRPLEPWLAAVARYKWVDRIRAMKRWRTEEVSEDLAVPDHETAVVSATVLDQLLASLKPAQAEVIRLVKLQGFSIQEAAERTGQSPPLVKVNIHRGLARLMATAQHRPV